MLDYVCERTKEYINSMPKVLRKKYGQFFTSKDTAVFMASLFNIPVERKELYLLDPGAGSGILCTALIERLQKYKFNVIHLVCYENDSNITSLLKTNIEYVSSVSNIDIDFTLVKENYITSQELDFNLMIGANIAPQKYDIVIANPPYMKIAKDANEAKAMPEVCYGAPNLYFLFAAMSLFNLNNNGEMVYIIPRSWTSGAYFKSFRNFLFKNGVLTHIHLFARRDEVFEQEKVLQETIIIKVVKTKVKPTEVIVSTTKSNNDFSEIERISVPYDEIISSNDYYVYLITDTEEKEILERLKNLNDTLPSLGLKMKTGLTVDFRNKDMLRDKSDNKAVPLFYSQHIKDGKVLFPIGKENEYIATDKNGLLQKNENYLFVKRFTSKEEKRRLQCGIYLARRHPGYDVISTQNKINFITGLRALSECVIYGLYVIFNSSLYDKYYRILNGSTQVNSTEVNSMPMPTMKTIEQMGKELIKAKDLSENMCNQILRCYI